MELNGRKIYINIVDHREFKHLKETTAACFVMFDIIAD